MPVEQCTIKKQMQRKTRNTLENEINKRLEIGNDSNTQCILSQCIIEVTFLIMINCEL